MRGVVRAAMAVLAAALCLAGCSNTPAHESVSVTHDTITDRRDGKTYKIITIKQQTWMAENLNYLTSSGSWCYDSINSNCGYYGRLYDWNTARKACFSGWHLPTKQDWESFGKALGGVGEPDEDGNVNWYGLGRHLKAKICWYDSGGGTNNYGFSAMPGGVRLSDNGRFVNSGYFGFWWTDTDYGNSRDSAYFLNMRHDHDIVSEFHGNKGYGMSVRCRRDN
ncbi:MAG: hypothetical protein LBC59_06615 [Chitinispirillales bacterium]|jgi:uncharacterized protein (TIGR02145 family)|nr:hypothetical protein [Chitinispirillales bacterium]